jgi:penicillin-binding protein 1A
MVKVAVSAGGRLLPGGSGGITEYVKAEDLERMESVVDYDQTEENATPDEESFDIF